MSYSPLDACLSGTLVARCSIHTHTPNACVFEDKLVDLLTHNWSSKCQCNRSLYANSREVAVNGGAAENWIRSRDPIIDPTPCSTHLLKCPLNHDSWSASRISLQIIGQLILTADLLVSNLSFSTFQDF